MNILTKRSKFLYFFIFLFIGGVIILTFNILTNAKVWALKNVNQHLYTNGNLTSAGAIYDRNGTVLVKTKDGKRVYNSDKTVREATLHVVGDSEGFIATGIQTAYRSQLTGYSFINGVYEFSKNGGGNDISLTIDADLCATALKALGKHMGTVGVYNYKTGEIYCMVSSPTFDINNKPKDIATDSTGKYDGIYLNRFLSGVFTPGSTFKIVTATSAIENVPDIYSQTFNCPGYYTIGHSKVICNSVHGTVNFEKALNRSCNSAFANIADQVGREEVMATATQMDFNKNLQMDGINVTASKIDLTNATKLDLGWAGIGQFTTLVNPFHELTILGAVANGGTPVMPYVLTKSKSIFNTSGRKGDKYMDYTTATKVKAMLRSNVVNYYSDKKFPNLQMCGKTGTAEVKGKKCHTWFVGFSENGSTPLAIVVLLQNSGGSGLSDAIPVANTVMQEAVNIVS